MYQFFSSQVLGLSADTANWIANGVLALIAIIVLIMLFRMFTRPRMAGGRRSKNARLAITDAASIDERRRLVLVRRDDVEHLIMIGGASDMVIESNIQRGSTTQPGLPTPASTAGISTRLAPIATRTPAATQPTSPAKPAQPAPPAKPTTPVTPVTVAPATKTEASPVVLSPNTPASPSKSVAPAPILKTAPVPSNNPTPAATTRPKISSVIGEARPKPNPSTPSAKSTMGDDMDALLSEITTNK